MILFRESADDVTPDQLHGFFVAWPNPLSLETHLEILRNSYRVVLAVDKENNRVVGFVNAISDGVLSAYVPLLEVLPEYQKQGIGRELVRRMLALLSNLYMIDLTCDPELQPYYESIGLVKSTGMMKRNYDRQSGEPPK